MGLSHDAGALAYGEGRVVVNMLTETLVAELASAAIRVKGVTTGPVRTRFSEALWKGESAEKKMLGRIAEPGHIVEALAFFASDDSAGVTAQTLVVDGAMPAR